MIMFDDLTVVGHNSGLVPYYELKLAQSIISFQRTSGVFESPGYLARCGKSNKSKQIPFDELSLARVNVGD